MRTMELSQLHNKAIFMIWLIIQIEIALLMYIQYIFMKEKSCVIRVPKSLPIKQWKKMLNIISAYLKNLGAIFLAPTECLILLGKYYTYQIYFYYVEENICYIEENFLSCIYLYMLNISCLHSDNLSQCLWYFLFAKPGCDTKIYI